MDAQSQKQGGQRLAADIKASLAEPQHRFELNDPFAETTFRFGKTEDALAKASNLGASGFQGIGADGRVSQIRKVDGEWKRDDGKALVDIQTEADKESIAAIQGRAQQRAALGQGVDGVTDEQMAVADAFAFRRIQDPSWREAAAVQMANNAREYPDYKIGLDKAIPGYPGTAEEVYALNASAASAKPSEQLKSVGTPDNKVESNEIFTARQMDVKAVVPPEVEKQYLRVGDKFYHPSNTDMVAFEDKGNRLETKANSENIARSMVRIAEARGWDEIKVSGSESFRKQVWLEAAARDMDVKGYTPTETDKALLAKRLSESEASKVAKEDKPSRARENTMAESFAKDSPAEAVKKYPELAGAAAALAVIDKKAEADGLTPAQRAVVAARAHQNVANSIERGDIPEVKLRQEVEVKLDGKEEQEYHR